MTRQLWILNLTELDLNIAELSLFIFSEGVTRAAPESG